MVESMAWSRVACFSLYRPTTKVKATARHAPTSAPPAIDIYRGGLTWPNRRLGWQLLCDRFIALRRLRIRRRFAGCRDSRLGRFLCCHLTCRWLVTSGSRVPRSVHPQADGARLRPSSSFTYNFTIVKETGRPPAFWLPPPAPCHDHSLIRRLLRAQPFVLFSNWVIASELLGQGAGCPLIRRRGVAVSRSACCPS